MPAIVYYCLLLLFSLPTQAADWQQPAYLQQAFIEIALGREHEQSSAGILLRWHTPIRYRLHSEGFTPTSQLQQLVDVHMQQLASITQHPMQAVEHHANLDIFIVPSQHQHRWLTKILQRSPFSAELLNNNLCLGQFKAKQQGIYAGIVLIPLDRVMAKGRLADCIIEELTQVMGLPNDSNRVFPSIFNDNSIDRYLTGLDWTLLKMLYHPQLRAGMTTEQVRPLLPNIIQQLQQQGVLERAEREARRQGLFPLIE
ncbi:DUF2927 domain-containing protein [Balneatrix alpica]|uniref:DUF2927 domain-containing protein n=1 Tax=Balneatrix alpica TaxID=75684 RepID=A0ABV5Z7G6_9GAMM|nr:DUF2927 domain-containing protein [Balneatrix alpica]